jgi:hypothetical protein
MVLPRWRRSLLGRLDHLRRVRCCCIRRNLFHPVSCHRRKARWLACSSPFPILYTLPPSTSTTDGIGFPLQSVHDRRIAFHWSDRSKTQYADKQNHSASGDRSGDRTGGVAGGREGEVQGRSGVISSGVDQLSSVSFRPSRLSRTDYRVSC